MDPTFNVMSLCSGLGGIDLAIRLAVPGARSVLYCEREGYPLSILVQRMEEGLLDSAPVWTDLTSLDGRAWRGVVHLLTAGFPCQGNSVAGSRLGIDDPRWLWPHIARLLAEVQPPFVFLENVPGLLSVSEGGAFHEILSDLASLGFDTEYGTFRASDVGATHRRDRFFLLGRHRSVVGQPQGIGRGEGWAKPAGLEGGSGPTIAGSPVADTHSPRLSGSELEGVVRSSSSLVVEDRAPQQLRGPSLADASSLQPERLGDARDLASAAGDPEAEVLQRERSGGTALDSSPGALPLFPPGPDDMEGWLRVLSVRPDLAPAVPAPTKAETQRELRRVADELPIGLDAYLPEPCDCPRVDQLRALGNAVVPSQVACAFLLLAERFVISDAEESLDQAPLF